MALYKFDYYYQFSSSSAPMKTRMETFWCWLYPGCHGKWTLTNVVIVMTFLHFCEAKLSNIVHDVLAVIHKLP